MKTYGKAALLGGVIAGGLAIGLAISPATAQKPEDRPVFHTSTTAAVVDVIVRDRTGKPVRDLAEADFEILEDGVPQRIISFESHVSEAPSAGPGEPDPTARTAGASVAPTQSLVALVFQQLPHQSRAMAVNAARSTIDALAPDEFAGVFVVELGLKTMAPFTRDRAELRAAVDKILTRAPVSLGPMSAEGVAERAGSAGGEQSLQDRQFGDIRHRLQSGLEAPQQQAAQATSLSALTSMMSRFAGRKSVILFSEGLAVSPRMDGVLALAQGGNVTFYTIDASGLGAGGPKALPRSEVDPSELTGSSQIRRASWQKTFPEMDPTGGLGPLADRTGGFFVSDTNDLAAAVAEVNRDRRAFYVLAYASRQQTGNDAARHLEVRVNRPGVSVRARSGVLAAEPDTR
jgi:VWFA-related protein